MSELKTGQRVNLTMGSTARVVKELGRGGQGIVYLVELGGKPMALKWYHTPPADAFYKNLENNVRAGTPSNAFIWPEYLTKQENGSYGYVMKLRPQGYYEFGNYLLARQTFASLNAMLAAAMKICEGFYRLHLNGYSYQDLNDGNFFIRPTDGDVLICDNDNVMPQGQKSGIMGKARYMAPEIVAGGTPDKYSDRFSLAVILFMLFFGNHPFEGLRVVKYSCMTEEAEKRFYGSEAVFICDPQNATNRPVRGIHENVIRRWPHFPLLLRNAFIEQFGKDRLQNPNKRMLEQEWEKIISRVRDELLVCPACKEETFLDPEAGKHTCMNCGKPIDASRCLVVGQRKLIMTPGTHLYIDKDNTPDALVSVHPKDKNLYLLKNLTRSVWNITTPTGKSKRVEPQGFMPVLNGLKIAFGTSLPHAPNAKGEIEA